MRGVRIRLATPSDSEGILECLQHAFEQYRHEYTPKAFTATVLTETMLRRRLRTMSVWVAADGKGRILGTVAIKRISPRRAHLRGTAVLPRYQGRGIASSLLDAVIGCASEGGQHHVTLETTEPLRNAERFYLSHGFRRTGRYRRWGGMKLVGFERSLPVPRRLGPRTRNRPVSSRGARGPPQPHSTGILDGAWAGSRAPSQAE